uniref:Uncharacterized protein n=1 Tax=Hanusia phi TaxID=3032 RepID=A0A7S0HJH0_9CRYP|mmetsp:Transcript_28549/g.64747  ORF Transcript_28549/g.64747 Transcript_28549/m.64747 type:complete len:132 (+) Transcript_28549:347-742(+)
MLHRRRILSRSGTTNKKNNRRVGRPRASVRRDALETLPVGSWLIVWAVIAFVSWMILWISTILYLTLPKPMYERHLRSSFWFWMISVSFFCAMLSSVGIAWPWIGDTLYQHWRNHRRWREEEKRMQQGKFV